MTNVSQSRPASPIAGGRPRVPNSAAPKRRNTVGMLVERVVPQHYWPFIKWSIMSSALFWMLVYHLSQNARAIPDFVYVNF